MVILILIPDGERAAALTVSRLLDRVVDERQSVIAVGGGVLGMCPVLLRRFVRGIPVVQVPDLACSGGLSIGGNRRQPSSRRTRNVLSARLVSRSNRSSKLPEREYAAACELKYGIIWDGVV
jgi:hypothetical protein